MKYNIYEYIILINIKKKEGHEITIHKCSAKDL